MEKKNIYNKINIFSRDRKLYYTKTTQFKLIILQN